MKRMDEDSRTALLWFAVVGLVIFTLVKCLILAHRGDGDAFAVYLLGMWAFTSLLIFTAKIGQRKKTRLIMFSLPTAPVVIFGLVFLVGEIQHQGKPEVAFQRAVKNSRFSRAENILEKEDLGEEELQRCLRFAVSRDAAEAVNLLVGAGADPNRPDSSYGERPLFTSVSSSALSAARSLLAAGADVTNTDEDGVNALHFAAEEQEPELIALFLEAGADPNARDAMGRTALHHVGMGMAWDEEEAAVVALLLDAGADPNAFDHRGFPPANFFGEAARKLLADRGGRRVETHWEGKTDLHLAAETGDAAEVRRILAEGFLPTDIRDDHEWTPLMYAVAEGYPGLARMLLEAGADVEAVAKGGWTPLLAAANSGSVSAGRLLVEYGADIHAPGEGWTALTSAVWSEHADFVRFLLRQGAGIDAVTVEILAEGKDPSIRSMILEQVEDAEVEDWSPAVFAALKTDDADMLRILADAGADLAGAVSGKRGTAHYAAVYCEDPEIFAILQRHDVDVFAAGESREQPFDLAVKNDNITAFEILWPEVRDAVAPGNKQPVLDAFLHDAVKSASPRVAAKLIFSGADAKSRNELGKPVLNEIPEIVFRGGVNLQSDEAEGIVEELVDILMSAGATPEDSDEYGNTAFDVHEEGGLVREAITKRIKER